MSEIVRLTGKNVPAVLLMTLVTSMAACGVLKRMDGLEHTDMTMSVTFSADSSKLMATRDHDIVVWDAEKGHYQQKLVGHRSVVTSVAFSPDGRLVVSAANDGSIKVWNLIAGREVRELAQGQPGGQDVYKKEVNIVIFSPSGESILTGGNDGNLNIWNSESGKLVRVLPEGSSIQTLGFGPSTNLVFVGNGAGAVHLWDLETASIIRTFEHDAGSFLDSLSISSDGKMMLSVCLNSVKLWDIESGEQIRTFNEQGKEYHTPTHVVFSPKGDLAYVADYGCIYVWDILSNKRLRKLTSNQLSHVTSLAISRDGKYLVAGDIWGDITRWQVGSGDETPFVPKSDQDDGVQYRY
jgi:WD40 repeat protein